MQDWLLKPQLKTVVGVADIDSLGGYEKQYVVEPNTTKLVSYGLSYSDIAKALQAANLAVGANYIQAPAAKPTSCMPMPASTPWMKSGARWLPRAAASRSPSTMSRSCGSGGNSAPGLLADKNGQEVVIGTALMLTGENSRAVATAVRQKLPGRAQELCRPEIAANLLLDRSQPSTPPSPPSARNS